MRVIIGGGIGIQNKESLQILIDNLNTLQGDTEAFAKRLFFSVEVQNYIIKCNQALLSQGLRPDGTEIEKVPEGNQTSNLYERFSIYQRQKLELQTQYVDLKRTGFFYASLKVKAGSEELLEYSDDPKSAEIERVWGNILGISSEDLLYLIDNILRPRIKEFVNNKLRLKK